VGKNKTYRDNDSSDYHLIGLIPLNRCQFGSAQGWPDLHTVGSRTKDKLL
jgi:hypothetical protein